MMRFVPLAGLRTAIVTAGFIAAAVWSGDFSWRTALAQSDPHTAYARYPTDGRSLSRSLALNLDRDPTNLPSARDLANIRASLVNLPLNAPVLGMAALRLEVDGRQPDADKLMRLANRVSRRDVLSQLWLIERASSSGKVEEALRHYHAVLSVQPVLSKALLPVLSSALAFPEVRVALQPYLAAKASWTPSLLSIASDTASPSDLVDLTRPVLVNLKAEEFAQPLARIIYRLAANGQYDAAMEYAAQVFDGFDPRAFKSFAVTDQTSDPRLGDLAWRLAGQGDIHAERDETGGIVISANPLAAGQAMVRDIPVNLGTGYLVSFVVRREPGSPALVLRWQARCLSLDGRFLQPTSGFVPVPEGAANVQQRISAGNDCRILRYALEVEGPDGQLPGSVRLTDLELRPL